MSDIIKLKRSGVTGAAPTSLELGEIALNYADGKVFYKNLAGSIVEFGGGGSDPRWAYLTPAAPTNVTASSGNAQAVVSWTAPSSLVAISDYVVQYSSNSGSSWTTFADGTSATASTTVTGLTNNTSYTFRVAAVSGIGQGEWSAASAAVTPNSAVFVPIPSMTSNTTPGGTVSSDSSFNSEAWYLFDGNPSNVWYSGRSFEGYPFPHWAQYDFGGQKSRISGYSISTALYSPASWTFSGSNNGTDFTVLDTQSSSLADGTTTQYTLASPVAYSIYRWTFTSGQNGNILSLQALGVFA